LHIEFKGVRESKAVEVIYNGKYVAVLHNLMAFEPGVSIGLYRPFIILNIGTIIIVFGKE
jgi:hypothetical protein